MANQIFITYLDFYNLVRVELHINSDSSVSLLEWFHFLFNDDRLLLATLTYMKI